MAVGLASCQPQDSSDVIFDNYLYRLKNSLDVQAPPFLASPTLVSYPSRRNLHYLIPPIKINLLEFLRLSQCELQRHIGQRNSGLGKLMEPTQQLIYDVRFLDLAKKCLLRLDNTHALYKTLEQAIQHKAAYLPQVIWNASFASKEFSYLFSLGSKTLSVSDLNKKSQQLDNALEQLAVIYQKAISKEVILGTAFIDPLESHYKMIASSKRVGEIRLSLREVTAYLQQADSLLEQRLKNRPLCVKGMSKDQYKIVEAVFYKFYIGEIQPYVAHLYQQSGIIFTNVDELLLIENSNSVFARFWNDVYRDDDSEWGRFKMAIKWHTENWQLLLKQCGGFPV